MKQIYIGITTTTTRQNYLIGLIDSLKGEGLTNIQLFIDNGSYGLVENKKRCFLDTILKAKDNNGIALLLEDDIAICKDFKNKLHNILQNSKTDIITLFTRQKHLIGKQNSYGLIRGIFKRGFYEQAVLIKGDYDIYNKVMKFRQNEALELLGSKRIRHPDVVFQEYLIKNNIEWSISIPTLVEHIGKVSSLGHDVGTSSLFIDNI